MILEGVLDNSLGNFICLRGFASLGDLDKISAPDESYQRDLITEHRQEMIDFLNEERFLFFPEVILGASLDDGSNLGGVNDFILALQGDKGAKHEFTEFTLRDYITSRSSPNELRSKIYFRRTRLMIDDALLEESSNFSKFHRIDGNHRLSVLTNHGDSLDEELRQKFSNYNVPFCLVLFRSDDELKRYSRALFHNINFRQIALTMEQSLKLILEDEALFSDDVLRKSFGESYVLARKMLLSWNLSMLQNIKAVLDPQESACIKRTFLLNSFQLLLDGGLLQVGDELDVFKKHLAAVNEIYSDERLYRNPNEGLLTAFIYYAFKSKLTLNVFTNWVLKNHLYQTKNTDAKELIKIFNCVLEAKKRTIFVSMQFSSETKSNHTAIMNAVNDVNTEHKLDLELREIRIDEYLKGHSYEIDSEILQLIYDSGLLIADLSLGNKNVYHEIGYLMGANKGAGLSQDNFILVHNKSISGSDFSKDVGFNIKSFQVLTADDTNDLREKVKTQLEIFYNLRMES